LRRARSARAADFARAFEARAQVLESPSASRVREIFLRARAHSPDANAQRLRRFEIRRDEAHDSSCESSCGVI
jgi:hypothetical protein